MTWPVAKLDELGFVGRGRSRNRPRDAAHLYGGPYPFVQTGDVKHAGLYLTRHTQTYSEAGLAQSKLWDAGTLCITIAANIADTAILGMDACFPDSVIGFVSDPKKADARFVKYAFDALLKSRYEQFSQGAAQANLSQEKLLSLSLPAPDVRIQKNVADILARYDALIENNRNRVELLEESLQLIYREWFVSLRFPGHGKNKTANALPDGWERTTLDAALILQRGFDLPVQERINGNVPIYGATGICGFHSKAGVAAPGVVTGRSGSLGSVYFVQKDFWPLNTALWVKEFRKASPLFAVHLLRSLNLKQFNGGVSVPTLDRKVAHRASVILPPKSLMDQFEAVAADCYSQMEKLTTQISKLTEARDLLLPKLMSGEVQV